MTRPVDDPAQLEFWYALRSLCGQSFAGELVTAIDLPAEGLASNYTYLKLRDRLSYAFALVWVAVAMKMEDGEIA